MCLYPTLIKNKRYLPNKKNGGLVPRCDDDRKLLVPIGCGKCIECAKKKQREWQVRLLEDIKEKRSRSKKNRRSRHRKDYRDWRLKRK